MRGGDRPKGAHAEFSDVSVMPRSMWEPWLCSASRWRAEFRTTAHVAYRRIQTALSSTPFGDVIRSAADSKGGAGSGAASQA